MDSSATQFRRHLVVLGVCLMAASLTFSVLSPGDNSYQRGASTLAAGATSAGSGDRQAEIEDAIKKNGTIFDDWPKPDFALVFSGEMDGYLEPCGCAGLENQKGGLKRRHSLIKQLRKQGWEVVPLDMGGQVRRLGPQAEMKYRYALESLIKIGYSAIGIGSRELQLSTDAILYALANLDPDKNPLLSANVALFGEESGFSRPYQVFEVAGKRIGVTSVLGSKYQATLAQSEEITWQPPRQALDEVVFKLKEEQCDMNVLLVHADPEEAKQLARRFPRFQLVATTGGAEEPPNRLLKIEGSRAKLVEVGQKGMYVIVVGIYSDRETPVRFQRVPLDHRFEDSPEMQQMLVDYQQELKGTGFSALGITGVKHPRDGYVGSEACADCHSSATEVFLETPHSHATKTLVDLDPPRHFDPECLSCHATGWNPQKYFPYESGFHSLDETPHLTANGCENCHGPGASHVAAESGDEEVEEVELERRRAAMRLSIVENEGNKDDQVLGAVVKNCLECHDVDNSPDFDFQEYWPHVEHYGLD